VVFSQCAPHAEDRDAAPSSLVRALVACPHDPPLTWSSYGQLHLEKHCNGCHASLLPQEMRNGAPVGVDFDTLDAVVNWHERIVARALGDAPTMPPGGGPSATEQALFAEWLACDVAARGE
jgi:uncharacterized membrane protein